MSDPDRFQALMLEHLYGLLDADEARELEAYLATPDGAGLRAQAEGWKGRLAEAALVGFPDLRFEPPSKTAAPEPVRIVATARDGQCHRRDAPGPSIHAYCSRQSEALLAPFQTSPTRTVATARLIA